MKMVNIMTNAIKDYGDMMPEVLPSYLREELNLMPIYESIGNIHFPKDKAHYIKARRRLVFEELITLQLGLFLIKNRTGEVNQGICFPHTEDENDLIDKLPFKLTSAQERVYREVKEDMEKDKQMNRLIQGDDRLRKDHNSYTCNV